MSREPQEQVFSIDDLVEAVKAIPPTSQQVVERFAGKCYLVSSDCLNLSGTQVAEIVNFWPGGCQTGRDAFLKGLEIKQEIKTVTIDVVEVFSVKSGVWSPCFPEHSKKLKDIIIGGYDFSIETANPDRSDKMVARGENITFDAVKLKSMLTNSTTLHFITGAWVNIDTADYVGTGKISFRFKIGEVGKTFA